MKKYQRNIYILMASMLLITILVIILIHSFNSIPEPGNVNIKTTTKATQYGD